MKKSFFLSLIFAITILFSANNNQAHINKFVGGVATIFGVGVLIHVLLQYNKIKKPNNLQLGGACLFALSAGITTGLGLICLKK